MQTYQYRAYTSSGSVEQGQIQARDKSAAVELIYQRGLYPFETVEAASGQQKWWQKNILGGDTVSSKDLSVFTRELATLLQAQLPLDEALKVMAAQGSGPGLQKVTQGILDDVLGGAALSEALRRQNIRFPGYYLSLVMAGEASGSLAQVFGQLAEFMDRAQELKSRITSALVYPLILMVMAVAALLLIALVLIPNLAPIFEDAGVAAPFLVRAVLLVQHLISSYWGILFPAFFSVCFVLIFVLKTEAAKSARDKIVLRLPLIGPLLRNSETAKVARTLGLLLHHGLSLTDALAIIKTIPANRTFRAGLETVQVKIREGGTLHGLLSETGLFPPLALRLIRVGEEAGRLEEMLFHTAHIHETNLQRQIERYMTMLTPVLTIVIGLMVGGLIMSVMNALLSINDLAFK